jgi:hypothetical protein
VLVNQKAKKFMHNRRGDFRGTQWRTGRTKASLSKSCGEGPIGFRWHKKLWVIIDEWKGLGVFRSDDANHWSQQPVNLLATPGNGADDHDIGRHCDVVVSGDRVFLFYFTHPGLHGNGDAHDHRRSSLQVTELRERDGWPTCDRDEPTHILLLPQK